MNKINHMKRLEKKLQKEGFEVEYYEDDNAIHVDDLIENDYLEINLSEHEGKYLLVTHNSDWLVEKTDLVNELNKLK